MGATRRRTSRSQSNGEAGGADGVLGMIAGTDDPAVAGYSCLEFVVVS